MKADRLLTEMFVGEALVEVPDEWIEPFKKVLSSATKGGRLPPDSSKWVKNVTPPKNRRAADKAPPKPPRSSEPKGEPVEPDSRSGRVIPATNRFRNSDEPETPAKTAPVPAATSDFDDDERTNPDIKPPEPDSPYPVFPGGMKSAAQKLGTLPSQVQGKGPGEDEYFSPFDWDKIDPHGLGDKSPETIPSHAKVKGKNSKGGSIANLFRRKAKDPVGKKKMDRALKDLDKKASGKQGMLNRLIKGRDPSKADRWNESAADRPREGNGD